MNQCSPVDMRKCLLIVSELKRQGIEFVALPVISANDREFLTGELQRRLDILIEESEKDENHIAMPVVNLAEKEMVEHCKRTFSPGIVEQIVKQKGKVTVFVLDRNGNRRIEKVELDPWPNCETGRYVVPKDER
jgi:hypothetical protein